MARLSRIDLRRGSASTGNETDAAVVPRAELGLEAAVETVHPVCEDVRRRGRAAVLEATETFDGVRLDELEVRQAALDEALERLDPRVREGLEESVRRLRRTCEAELEADVTTQVATGATVRRRIVPVGRVGLYVPGGLAPLVSSVVMNAVPAQVAGVGSVALASPPQASFNGRPHPSVLAACALLGIDEVYAVGGAQAIAMFGHGAGECAAVDLVTGPGNIYVAAAKRLLRGTVGVDAEAGPTEIAVLADETADPSYVAADLVSQAEHDPSAASVLVTDSSRLADAVEGELDRQVPAAKHADRIEQALCGPQSAVVLVDDLEQGLEVVESYGAEHLEVQTADASAVAERVHNAGAVFVGPHTPVSLGDYVAGSNHVLPTGGSAAHSSGLSVRAFCRNVQVVTYDRAALQQSADHVVTLAEAEDLPAHGAAVRLRTDGVR